MVLLAVTVPILILIAVNKADGDNVAPARRAAADYRMAVHMMTPASEAWTPPVLTCSGVRNEGLDEIWAEIERHRDALGATGELHERRQEQQIRWMWSMVEDRLLDGLRSDPKVASLLPGLERAVRDGTLPPTAAAERLLHAATT